MKVYGVDGGERKTLLFAQTMNTVMHTPGKLKQLNWNSMHIWNRNKQLSHPEKIHGMSKKRTQFPRMYGKQCTLIRRKESLSYFERMRAWDAICWHIVELPRIRIAELGKCHWTHPSKHVTAFVWRKFFCKQCASIPCGYFNFVLIFHK